jgi:8-oxo-dGTP pyrophosphatase MutT (NUDIX family)
MRKPNFYASVYWIIKNREWEILFAKRGKNASWFIWRYQIPAGHIDWGETIFEALRREMKEELTIEIYEKDKCSDLVYKSITDIDSIKVLTHDIIAINNINKKLPFSELLLKDSEY